MQKNDPSTNMNALKGRQDPVPDEPIESKAAHLDLIEDFLSQRWLQRGSGPFQALWRRKDALSTIELLTFGSALSNFKSKVSDSAYKSSANMVKSKDVGNSSAKIFEILASSMFEAGKQRVEIPKENNPGYDFSVTTGAGTKIRFSVKALLSSKHANEFKVFSNTVCSIINVHLKEHSTIFLCQKNFNHQSKYSVSLTTKGVKDVIDSGKSGIAHLTKNDWIVRIDALKPDSGKEFSSTKRSYTVLLMAPYHKNEQARFYSKIQEACDNLAKHCSDVSPQLGNSILIRIPSSISLADANQWLHTFWSPRHECISSVMIVRASYTSSDDLNQSWLTYEFSHVENPTAKTKLGTLLSSKLEMVVPIGQTSVDETKITMDLYGKKIDMKGVYWHCDGHHIYEQPFNSTDGKIEFNFKRLPYVRTSCIFTGFPDGGLEITPHFPPSDELLIL